MSFDYVFSVATAWILKKSVATFYGNFVMRITDHGRHIKTLILINQAQGATGLKPYEIDYYLSPPFTRNVEVKIAWKKKTLTKQIYKWINGTATISAINAKRLIRLSQCHECREIWEYTLFVLLDDKPLSVRTINRLTKTYTRKNTFYNTKVWTFPHDRLSLSEIIFERSGDLLLRQDKHSFFAIMALVRLAEAKRNQKDHLRFSIDALNAFQYLTIDPWFKDHIPQLQHAFKQVIFRVKSTQKHITHNW